LPDPGDLRARPAVLLGELEHHIGVRAAAELCADLLTGADPHEYAAELVYLAGVHTRSVLRGELADYWVRVWGARGLRYAWVDSVAPAVVAGLRDEHWRVAEMSVKVAGLRELGEAGDGVAALAGHELPRVRAAVVTTLGAIGDTEHVDVVRAASGDENLAVRRAAGRSMKTMVTRLDLMLDLDDMS